ncbi:MAG: hypothetical protein OXG07_10675 [Anaerolineaceae bacterium]|nr:hypothetical protein [Anaerolineaceae bacterium]MCY3908350.1 hypothetical protein [Anaerolineaceae bacterium]
MPLPNKIDEQICKRFDELIQVGRAFIGRTAQARSNEHEMFRRQGHMVVGYPDLGLDQTEYSSFSTRSKNLIRFILDEVRCQEYFEDIQKTEENASYIDAAEKTLGILEGLKDDYESGMLDEMFRRIEAEATYDFMKQAEQLLDGEKPEYDHVPAAVLAGAVLENGLRRLCQRQSPPIETLRENGNPKRLNSLIEELQGEAYNPAKGDQLKAWAKIRNAAAHGEIEKFNRDDVVDMIAGIKRFLNEYDL